MTASGSSHKVLMVVPTEVNVGKEMGAGGKRYVRQTMPSCHAPVRCRNNADGNSLAVEDVMSSLPANVRMDSAPSELAVESVEGATDSKPRASNVVGSLKQLHHQVARPVIRECHVRLVKAKGVDNGRRQVKSFQDAICAQWRPARIVLCDLSKYVHPAQSGEDRSINRSSSPSRTRTNASACTRWTKNAHRSEGPDKKTQARDEHVLQARVCQWMQDGAIELSMFLECFAHSVGGLPDCLAETGTGHGGPCKWCDAKRRLCYRWLLAVHVGSRLCATGKRDRWHCLWPRSSPSSVNSAIQRIE